MTRTTTQALAETNLIASKRGRTASRVRDLLKDYDTDSTVTAERKHINSLTAENASAINKPVEQETKTVKSKKSNVEAIVTRDGKRRNFREAQAYIKACQLTKDGYKATSWDGVIDIIQANGCLKEVIEKSAPVKGEKSSNTITVKDGVNLTFREAQAYIKANKLTKEGFKATSWAGIRAIIEG